jgi:hypothetical protein
LNDVREIYYLCLSLGFQGRYPVGDDPRELKDVKGSRYKRLCASNASTAGKGTIGRILSQTANFRRGSDSPSADEKSLEVAAPDDSKPTVSLPISKPCRADYPFALLGSKRQLT